MVRYAVLGSGSNGNSYVFFDGSSSILIDQGFSLVELRRRLDFVDIPFDTVRALCVTHLHPDHVKGAGTFARRTGLPVYLNRKMVEKEPVVLSRLALPEGTLRVVEEMRDFSIASFTLHCLPTSHDSGGSVGWSIASGGARLLLLTDLGKVTREQENEARDADVLFLESNYDEEMLAKGPYPLVLKRRIAGGRGHLSNSQATSFLRESGYHGRHAYLVHLSEVNNNPSLLLDTVRSRFSGVFTVCERGKWYQGTI